MSLAVAFSKIASAEVEVDSVEKLAACYDEIGREMAREFMKEARKLPPGMFSGKAGVMKLLAGGGLAGGGYAFGKHKAKKKGEQDDVQIAQKAYRAGVQRGAQAVIQRLKQMGAG
jgi:hypothetical protein